MRRCSAYLGRGQWLSSEGQTAVMGVINLTPDSFSDGGECLSVDAAVARARQMREDGALLLDVGGESTRPGANVVPIEMELRRVIPVVRALVERVALPISIDTRKAPVFLEAFAAGASILNDVSALSFDPEMARALAKVDAAAILMHSRGTPVTMDSLARYGDVVLEVRDELRVAVDRAVQTGVPLDRLWVDPGLGFAKTSAQSVELLRRLEELRDLGLPIVVGPSRKRFLKELTGRDQPKERDTATAAVVAHLAAKGVEAVRVHAVQGAVDAARIGHALALREPSARSPR